MTSKGVPDAWIGLKYYHSSDELVWGNITGFGVNASRHYMNNLGSYNCTDCHYEHDYSPVILKQDGSWEVVDKDYLSKSVVCMGFNEIGDKISLGYYVLNVIPHVLDIEIMTSEEYFSWWQAAQMCVKNNRGSFLAPVATEYLQKKVYLFL